jgi:hypothetical protein
MGDSRFGDNITIPVVVKSPDGSAIAANVSIPNLKIKTPTGTTYASIPGITKEITGIGELSINISNLSLSAGRYEFELRADSTVYGLEYLNEWMWPRSVVRNFLVDSSSGYGGIITDFVGVKADSYGGWGSTSRILNLMTVNGSDGGYGGLLYQGVAGRADRNITSPWSSPECTDWADPAGIGDGTNYTYQIGDFDNQYFAYYNENATYAGLVWLKNGDCNFTSASNYSTGDPVNITLGSDTFMLYVLNSSIGITYIGIEGLDSSLIEPVRIENWGGNNSPMWQMISVNRSGVIYDFLFANDTSLSYPQANTWGMNEVSKAVWISTDGNYSSGSATKYLIGDNFTADEYVARLGPGSWEGILIVNSSNLTSLLGAGVRPGMDLRIGDSMLAYFGKINESATKTTAHSS